MKTFSQLEQEWNSICSNDPSLASLLEEKISPLLNHTEEEYVVQGMDLLLQCGSSSLVFILEENEGSFEISEKYSGNVRSVERCVILEVGKEASEWFGLFDSGFFDGMVKRLFWNTDWNELSDTLQQRLLKEVRQMVEVPGKKYSIGKYQVTQALWESVMGNNPSSFKGSSRPVECVNWMDCVLFCNKLSEKEGLEEVYTLPSRLEQALNNQTDDWDENVEELSKEVSQNLESNGYRLPTEWEWWFAAKANQDFEYSGSDNPDEVAWTSENSNWQSHSVGQKKCNGFGLYDMSGNVFEWCWDWCGDDDPTEDSTGPSTGSYRVNRGGGWCIGASDARVSIRGGNYPSSRYSDQGFRFTRTIR